MTLQRDNQPNRREHLPSGEEVGPHNRCASSMESSKLSGQVECVRTARFDTRRSTVARKQVSKTTQRRRSASIESADSRAARIVRRIAAELQRGQGAKAVRMCLDAEAHHLLPKGGELYKELVRVAGKDTASRLIHALATFSCFYCKKGLEKCETCEGLGASKSRIFCNACLGLGIVRCDCCDGSGWITIDCVPQGLRPAVVAERVALGKRGLKHLLAKPVPKPAGRKPSGTRQRCTRQMLEVNRLIGVFENTVNALKEFRQSSSMPKQKIGILFKTCLKAGAEGDARIRQILGCIASSARLEAETFGVNTVAGRIAHERADAYEKLRNTKTYTGTMLDHPFLMQAVTKVIAKAHSRRAEGAGRASRRGKKRVRGKKL